MSSTRISRRVNARRAIVYRALLDARGRDVDGADRHDQPRACVRRSRSAEFRALTTRVLEWQARRPFRVAGPADAIIGDRVQARATQPVAGSYRFLIRLVAPAQAPLFPDMPNVEIRGVADALFKLVTHASSGALASAEELKRLVPDEQYRSTMLKLVRNIVPAGKRVGEVEIARITKATPDAEPVRTSVLLTKESRAPIAEAIKATPTEPPEEHFEKIKGTLRAVHLDQDWLVVVQEDGTSVRCEGAGSSVDDVLGPLVNRPVILRARRRGIVRKLHLVDIEPDPDVG